MYYIQRFKVFHDKCCLIILARPVSNDNSCKDKDCDTPCNTSVSRMLYIYHQSLQQQWLPIKLHLLSGNGTILVKNMCGANFG